MKTSEWNDLTTQNVVSTKMPSFPLLSALTLHRSKIDPGTWIQIFSIFSNPWGISMLFGTERERIARVCSCGLGYFLSPQVCVDMTGKAADPDIASVCHEWWTCAFQQRPWPVVKSIVFRNALACEAFPLVYWLIINVLEARILTLKNLAASVYLVMKNKNFIFLFLHFMRQFCCIKTKQ